MHSTSRSARFLYFAHGPLAPAELSSARLDGHLFELGEGYVPADAIETAGLRAASLAPLVDERLAATHLTAAWIHGAIDTPPARHAVQRAVPHRIRLVIDHRLVYRDGRIEPRDLARVGGVRVTTVARTLADLTRRHVDGDEDPSTTLAVRRLVASRDAVRAAIVCLAMQDAVPGKPKAMAFLRAIEEQATTT